jgi:hypothetical protein
MYDVYRVPLTANCFSICIGNQPRILCSSLCAATYVFEVLSLLRVDTGDRHIGNVCEDNRFILDGVCVIVR